jgi:23S rRNA (guanosine2251-2'-O)-methyltransferase
MKQVIVLLPNIHSTHNVGSFFRTADGAGVSKIVLSGFTARPDQNEKIGKVALGAEQTVDWEYIESPLDAIEKYRAEGFQIIAVEQTAESADYREAKYAEKVLLIFGNERTGVPKEESEAADFAVHIPMHGQKESLNVSIAGGVMLYHVCD